MKALSEFHFPKSDPAPECVLNLIFSMPIDFTLSPAQQQLVQDVRNFAESAMPAARDAYQQGATPLERFQATRPFHEQAVKAGLFRGMIPVALGGTATSAVDAALVAEELEAVDGSLTLSILSNGLGLAPIVRGGSKEQQSRFLPPFLAYEGTPLASLVFSEYGGSANWLNPAARGIQTIAEDAGDYWLISGEKLWPTSSAGWDFKGPDLSCIVCRTDLSLPPSQSIVLVVATREDMLNQPHAFTVLDDVEPVGNISTSGPHIRYTKLRVPKMNTIGSPGQPAIDVIVGAFTESAALVAAMSVGLMRAAFEHALHFAKTQDRNGTHAIIHHQSVADLLISIKGKLEAGRYMAWKACHVLETKGDNELAYAAKVFCSDAAMEAVVDATRLVGVDSYNKALPYGRLLQDAMCMSIFDGGNIGVRKRQLQALFSGENYDPRGAALLSFPVPRSAVPLAVDDFSDLPQQHL